MFTFQRASYSGREKVCEMYSMYSVSFFLDYTSWLLLYLRTLLFFQMLCYLVRYVILKDEFENTPRKTLWAKFASELYRQSGRRRSAKLVLTFAVRGVSRGQRNGSPRPLISVF
jgi:hypothetical protein